MAIATYRPVFSPLLQLIFFLSFTISTLCHAHTGIVQNAPVPKHQISEENYIPINGINQWVTIKENPSKPIILFLHGGPGSPITPYLDVLYKNLEKDFIIVQWDQRGSGRTFGYNNPPEELNPEYLKANGYSFINSAGDSKLKAAHGFNASVVEA